MTEPNLDNPTLKIEVETASGEVVTVVMEFHFSDNAEDHLDIKGFVYGAATALMGWEKVGRATE